MGDSSFLTEFLIILVAATLVAVVLERFRLPAILGFLLAGVAIGPQGFGWIHDSDSIHQLAELGVVLLMLTIGLEFSFDRLKGLGRIAVFGGSLQILVSVALGFGFAALLGWNLSQGFFVGSVIALSSTAIVLKHLIDRGELDTHHGRVAVSILIFQDLAIVPLVIFTKGMGQSLDAFAPALLTALFKTVCFLTALGFFSKFVLPYFLRQIALTRNREVFFLAAVVICLGTAWISGHMGLSLAVGAFFAGLMFANTDYGGQLMGEVSSFRHIFVSIFFVSIGLLFDTGFAWENAAMVSLMVGLVLLVNFVVVTILLVLFRYPPRIAIAAGIILSQIGEFSFLLLEVGRESGGIDDYLYHLLLSTAFLTMVMTPFLFSLVPPILRLSEHIGFFGTPPSKKTDEPMQQISEHIILCGYGPSGRDLAHTFRDESLPFLIVEMNPGRIQAARKDNHNVVYGDAANVAVMQRAGIERANAVVVSFGDAIGMSQIIRVVEELNPDVLLVVRTRYERDVARLYHLGADIVIMEELEASHELNRVMLEHFGVDKEKIDQHLERIRTRKELLIEEAILGRHVKQ